MRISKLQKVRIWCPDQNRWPAFSQAFHDKVGIVVEEFDSFVKLDISTEKISVPYINVEKTWLRRPEASTK